MAKQGERSPGRLIVLAAPSGAGKTTLVRELLRRERNLRFSVSYTTRAPRAGETDGTDYFFVDPARFEQMVREGAFLEYANVFDHWYGTSRDHVYGLLATGVSVLLEIDWQGARQVRERAPEALTVFILPPTVATLRARLETRATDPAPVIARRLRDAVSDMTHWAEFDYVVINDDLDRAADALCAIVRGDGDAYRTGRDDVKRRVEGVFAA